jgi:tripartite-type tricarboxylate transporter receptor subunit TctC
LAPANTPATVVEQLNKALNLALQNKDVAGRLVSLGSAPTPMSSKEFGAFLMNEDAKAEALVKRGVLVAE